MILGAYSANEKALPFTPRYVVRYCDVDSDPAVIAARPAPADARVIVTLEPWHAGNKTDTTPFRDIANGILPDAWRAWLASPARAPLVRFGHEMNGNGWYPWQGKPVYYRAAYRVIAAVTHPSGQFIWCPNVDYPGAAPLMDFYPGDDVVNLIGVDGYSFNENGYPDVEPLFNSTLRQLSGVRRRVAIIETAASTDHPRRKTWASDLKELDVLFACWFDGQDGANDFRIRGPGGVGQQLRRLQGGAR